MFLKIINHKGFWKSVAVNSLLFGIVFTIIKWIMSGLVAHFFSIPFFIGIIIGSSIYGFLMTYGKFWGKLKNDEYKNRS